MIRLKNYLSQENILSNGLSQENFLVDYLKSISLEGEQSDRHKYGREKLGIAMRASQAIKESTSINEQEKRKPADATGATALIPSLEKELSVPQASISAVDSNVNSSTEKERLKLFLAEVADNRKRNELIYGYKAGAQEINKRWGIEEASEIADGYKTNIDSTVTRGEWAEFAISYDNKFFLSATSAASERNHYPFNHTTMGCGTFLKAAGKLKLEKNGSLIISPYSQYLTLGPAYLPIILLVLQEKGYPISTTNTFIVGEEGYYFQESVSYYLDRINLFPSAKAIAENKKLSIEARLSELFLCIDDGILSTKRQGIIKILNASRAVLKADIVGFLSLLVETNLCELTKGFPKQEQDVVDNLPNTGEGSSKQKQDAQDDVIEANLHAVEERGKDSKKQERDEGLDVISQETIYQRYKKIITHIESFQSHGIDISFVTAELLSWFYYLSALGFQADSKMTMMTSEKEGLALAGLQEIAADLTKIKETSSILPQRFIVESDGTVSPFIRLYTENPIKTCIALLRDYTKGGFLGRLFSGAWRRKHIKRVEQFLGGYESQQFADNLSIQTIYQELFGLEGALEEHPGKRGTLFARLLFCSKLANETQNESRHQELVDTPPSKTIEKTETEVEGERQVVTETLPSTIATTDETAATDSYSPSALEKTLELEMPSVRSGGNIRFHTLPPDENEGVVSNDKQASPAGPPTLSSSPSLSEEVSL